LKTTYLSEKYSLRHTISYFLLNKPFCNHFGTVFVFVDDEDVDVDEELLSALLVVG
jgi:hypothetical protein